MTRHFARWRLALGALPVAVMACEHATAPAPPVNATAAFTIDLRFFGPAMSPEMVNAFEAAKTRIESIITADVPDVTAGDWDVSVCGVPDVGVLKLPIDDIIIYAAVDSIDGPGNKLGSAGPCFIRPPNGLPLVGVMHFDKADLQGLVNDGRINDIILHEMLHTLGVGTMWATAGLSKYARTDSSTYTGPGAISGCQFHGGGASCAASVPLETTGNDGTRDVHWRDATSSTGIGFGVELMTGYVSPAGTPNPLSRITIGSLADLGYVVNMGAADAYTVPLPSALRAVVASRQGHGGFQINESLIAPIATLDANGQVVRIPR